MRKFLDAVDSSGSIYEFFKDYDYQDFDLTEQQRDVLEQIEKMCIGVDTLWHHLLTMDGGQVTGRGSYS